MNTDFSYEGEFYRSPKKKYEELIFFVHFFEGNKRLLLRHVKVVNKLGFDAFVFTLPLHWNISKPPLSAELDLGFKHLYARIIEELLNKIPGKKIIYSFSNPSASAIEAMAKRRCHDTVALICDSGPSAQFLWSALSLARQYLQEKSYVKALMMSFSPIFWTPKVHKDLKKHLEMFPKNFPILSIRGWKDALIPPRHIDEVFDGHPHLRWQKLSLPEAGHLNGLRDFKTEYMAGLIPFLERVATPTK